MVARYAIGQLGQQTVHFEDLEDLRTPKVCVEHMRPRDQLRQPFGGKEGPCTRLSCLDGEMRHELVCIVPAQHNRQNRKSSIGIRSQRALHRIAVLKCIYI